MKVHRICGPVAVAHLVAVLCIVLGAAAAIACSPIRLNVDTHGNRLSREVLPLDDNAARYLNLYDAIEHLRPEYLRVRHDGPTTLAPVAYLDGLRLIDPEMLRHVPVAGVVEVRWVRPNLTSPLYGSRHQLGGGIFVRTR